MGKVIVYFEKDEALALYVGIVAARMLDRGDPDEDETAAVERLGEAINRSRSPGVVATR